jgi:hypothetical protein
MVKYKVLYEFETVSGLTQVPMLLKGSFFIEANNINAASRKAKNAIEKDSIFTLCRSSKVRKLELVKV